MDLSSVRMGGEGLAARRGIAVLGLVSLMFLAGCGTIPSPEYVCSACEIGINQSGPNISVTNSSLDIRVHEDGDSTWVIRSDVRGPGVRTLQRNPKRVDQLAADTVGQSVEVGRFTHYSIHRGDVTVRSARLTNGTLRFEYEVDDFAYRSVGNTLVVEYFHTEGKDPFGYHVGADRMTVSGSSDRYVANVPPGANIQNGTDITWTGQNTLVQSHTYLVFAHEGDSLSSTLSTVAVSLDVIEWSVPKTVLFGGLYSLLNLVLVTGLASSLGGFRVVSFDEPDTSVGQLLSEVRSADVVGTVLAIVVGYAFLLQESTKLRDDGVFVIQLGVLTIGLFAFLAWSLPRTKRASRSAAIGVVGMPLLVAANLSAHNYPGLAESPGTFTALYWMLSTLLGAGALLLVTAIDRGSSSL